jgi:hypothetical protein
MPKNGKNYHERKPTKIIPIEIELFSKKELKIIFIWCIVIVSIISAVLTGFRFTLYTTPCVIIFLVFLLHKIGTFSNK